MKQKMTSLIAMCAFAGLAAPVFADCNAELAQMRDQAQMENSDGISKDGSLAPLESDTGDTSAAAAAAGDTSGTTSGAGAADTENEIVKDGSQAPLNTDLSNRATSGQDAAAQQEEAASADGAMSQEAQDALARAKAALEAGDEAGCMEAVEEARSL